MRQHVRRDALSVVGDLDVGVTVQAAQPNAPSNPGW